ncbi:MAG TPA: hypothetical protein VHZ73_08420 [Vicinamibacterales bacterium]|jgi:hypothetical protein|nr:hypothetical protein [Vicinamibacterales bacterium]
MVPKGEIVGLAWQFVRERQEMTSASAEIDRAAVKFETIKTQVAELERQLMSTVTEEFLERLIDLNGVDADHALLIRYGSGVRLIPIARAR